MGKPVRVRLALAAATLIVVAGVACEGKPAPGGKPKAALVLVYDKGKVARVHRLTGDAQVAALGAFFPGYERRPASDTAAGWKRGYEVYFDFPDGYSVRLSVSSPQNRPTHWSAGRGDFEVQGDFHKFVAELGD
jgi:hypothetical protein